MLRLFYYAGFCCVVGTVTPLDTTVVVKVSGAVCVSFLAHKFKQSFLSSSHTAATGTVMVSFSDATIPYNLQNFNN